MVKYKSINKNNVYKKNRRSKKLRKTVNSNLIGGSAEAPAPAEAPAEADDKKTE